MSVSALRAPAGSSRLAADPLGCVSPTTRTTLKPDVAGQCSPAAHRPMPPGGVRCGLAALWTRRHHGRGPPAPTADEIAMRIDHGSVSLNVNSGLNSQMIRVPPGVANCICRRSPARTGSALAPTAFGGSPAPAVTARRASRRRPPARSGQRRRPSARRRPRRRRRSAASHGHASGSIGQLGSTGCRRSTSCQAVMTSITSLLGSAERLGHLPPADRQVPAHRDRGHAEHRGDRRIGAPSSS